MTTKRVLICLYGAGTLGFMLLLTSVACAQPTLEAELLRVMVAKNQAYFDADTTKWQTFWVQDSSSSRAGFSKFGQYAGIGWPTVIAGLKEDSRVDGRSATTTSYANVHVRTSGNLAYVEADERQNWPELAPKQLITMRTYTVLARGNTDWKIANQVRVATDTYAKTPANRDYELNVIGYELLAEKRISEAIDLFRVNIKLHPDSWNAYDSLGEAYALAGDRKLAISNYEKSLVLNPKNEAGKAALAKLKK